MNLNRKLGSVRSSNGSNSNNNNNDTKVSLFCEQLISARYGIDSNVRRRLTPSAMLQRPSMWDHDMLRTKAQIMAARDKFRRPRRNEVATIVQRFRKQSMDIRTRFDALMERILREHQEARKQKDTGQVRDLLDVLLDISEDENMEMKLTTNSIKAFILDIFATGTDTSTITVEWTLAELINHPNIMKKAVEELDQVVPKNRLLQESNIPNLPYLQAIVKESLRLHPVVPLIQRLSTEDCTLSGYHIPANTTIFINVWEVGRDPTQWENPLQFMPERFENQQLDVRGQHFHLVPFGGGRRMCQRTSLALMEVHVTLGSMIQCFDWKARKDGNLDSVDMEMGNGVTLPRANPLNAQLEQAIEDPRPTANFLSKVKKVLSSGSVRNNGEASSGSGAPLCRLLGCSMMVKTMEVAWVWNDAGMLIVAMGVLKMLLWVFIGCSMMVKTMEVAWVWNDAGMLIVVMGVSRQWKPHGYFEDAAVGVYRHHLL
ncbi:cytochrome P450 93A3-like protein [Tanacetum coccineum]